MKRAVSIASYVGLFAVAAAPMFGFNYYVFCENQTNHTSIEPYLLLFLFVPVAFVSFRRIRKGEAKGWIFLLVALAGVINVFAFDALDIMKGYDSWAHSGMPDRPAWSMVQACSLAEEK